MIRRWSPRTPCAGHRPWCFRVRSWCGGFGRDHRPLRRAEVRRGRGRQRCVADSLVLAPNPLHQDLREALLHRPLSALPRRVDLDLRVVPAGDLERTLVAGQAAGCGVEQLATLEPEEARAVLRDDSQDTGLPIELDDLQEARQRDPLHRTAGARLRVPSTRSARSLNASGFSR